jgi:hypothetical protein
MTGGISNTNWERLATMTDEDIDMSDIPPLDDDFFRRAKLQMPEDRSLAMPEGDSDLSNRTSNAN